MVTDDFAAREAELLARMGRDKFWEPVEDTDEPEAPRGMEVSE